jgi:RimJ/RimL family protein N-acetyltransferase
MRIMPLTLTGPRLIMTTVDEDAAEELTPAFNGDPQFNEWSGTAELSTERVAEEIAQAKTMPGGATWRIALRDGTLVGVAQTAHIPRPYSAWIAMLVIMRPFQRRGLGSEVAEALEAHFWALPDVRHIGMGVHAVNASALAFWERRGYQRGMIRRDIFGSEIVSLRLDAPFPNPAP